ncbi:unnamed protein product [Didymodactylos carnosus]|uniref:EF-hand domain-containing protein n=1 Tax=Didymodactylos carnosus TaxID=1234261 RepID=A0A8S2DQ32_9BILA|nr:unnamed protein product [Didymodactylos carnosus]CAF3741037.1 unnamed protein product [Didymodactylos carnosus]
MGQPAGGIYDSRLDPVICKALQHPRSLDDMIKCTKFSRSEIRLLYRGFKQECPSGSVSEERLREIYLQFFPQGSPIKYAHYLFTIMDRNHKGTFTFDDYILTLSVLCRGTIEDKLKWIFRFYDISGDGQLSRESFADVIRSLYDLIGPTVQPRVQENEIQKHIDEILEHVDPLQVNQVTVEDFIEYCKDRPPLIESIQSLSSSF